MTNEETKVEQSIDEPYDQANVLLEIYEKDIALSQRRVTESKYFLTIEAAFFVFIATRFEAVEVENNFFESVFIGISIVLVGISVVLSFFAYTSNFSAEQKVRKAATITSFSVLESILERKTSDSINLGIEHYKNSVDSQKDANKVQDWSILSFGIGLILVAFPLIGNLIP